MGQYDNSNRYKGKSRKEYEQGYDEGYEAGYDDNYESADEWEMEIHVLRNANNQQKVWGNGK